MNDVIEGPVIDRLATFQTIVERGSQLFLERAGIAPGMRVLELGCGTGAMTCWLARKVGPHGSVIALDHCANSLAVLAARTAQAGLDNVVCQQVNLEQNIPAINEVDLVHGRFVLMHLRHSASLLCGLFDAMSPGSVLALEEPAISTFHSHADRQLWKFGIDLYRRYCRAHHVDPNFGGRLLNQVSEANFSVLDHMLSFAPMSYAQARRYMELSLTASSQRYIDAGLIERLILENYLSALSTADKNDQRKTHFHAVVQLIAYR